MSRDKWAYRGQRRPSFAVSPTKDQESVWDYPRPPRLVADSREFTVQINDQIIASTTSAVRVLETSGAPTIYFSRAAVHSEVVIGRLTSTFCEWKGRAHPTFWRSAEGAEQIGWTYYETFSEFDSLRDWFSFYPARVACFVDGERARAEPASYYGGWITNEIVGPFKGDPKVTD